MTAAFASAITDKTVMGTKRAHYGTYANSGGATGGDIDTGLTVVDSILLQKTGSAVATNAVAVNETLPADGSAITIVSDANEEGYWFAIGR